ncbi:Core component of nucleosome [Nowakowskiella sp. JEL0407]|nr:Core component of nucleosome [Nowakowskiella sp. JEL0407]
MNYRRETLDRISSPHLFRTPRLTTPPRTTPISSTPLRSSTLVEVIEISDDDDDVRILPSTTSVNSNINPFQNTARTQSLQNPFPIPSPPSTRPSWNVTYSRTTNPPVPAFPADSIPTPPDSNQSPQSSSPQTPPELVSRPRPFGTIRGFGQQGFVAGTGKSLNLNQPGSGKSGKYLQKIRGNTRRKIARENMLGITKPAIRRLARRGGVKRISGGIYREVRDALFKYLHTVIKDAVIYAGNERKQTLTPIHVVYALKRQGCRLYGFDDKTSKK